MTSDPLLRRWLLDYNTRHFAGCLPVDRITVFWEPCGKNSATTQLVDGDEYVIRIDPAALAIPRHAKVDLHHEMVHVKNWPYRRLKDHGARFDSEIQRLCGIKSYRKLL